MALLLEAGADPNHVTNHFDGLTPLVYASRYGLKSIVAMLCEAGADVNWRCGLGSPLRRDGTALHFAATHGHTSIVECLLKYVRDPDTLDIEETSPIESAATHENWTIMELLLDTGRIDLDRKTLSGDTILDIACQSRNCPDSLIRRLLGNGPGRVNSTGDRALIYSAQALNEAAVKMLLEAGVDPYLTGVYEAIALHAVADIERHDYEQPVGIAITQALLEANMDVDTRGSYEATALMSASGAGQEELVRFLLEIGADVHLRDSKGWSPLIYAAEKGRAGILSCLLRSGASPHNLHSLFFAALHGHVNILRILANAGADVDMAAEGEETALISAIRRGDVGVAEALIELGATTGTHAAALPSPFMLCATGGYKDLTKLMIDNGADARVTNKRGETTLVCVMRTEIEYAQSHGLPAEWNGRYPEEIQEISPMLLQAGVDVNASTNDGDTALFLATDPKYPRSDDVRLLLEAGARPSVSDRAKRTALFPWDSIDGVDVGILESLLKANTDSKMHDGDGRTAPMRFSWKRNQADKLKLFLRHGANPNASNNEGKAASILAVHQGNCDLRNGPAGSCSEHKDTTGQSALPHLVSSDPFDDIGQREQVFEALIDAAGGISNHQDTLLLRCARLKDSARLELLLAAGANPHGIDKDGRNTILLASMMGLGRGEKAVGLLLGHKVDPNQHDCNGDNALMLAARSFYSPLTLRALMGSGMNPYDQDAKGLNILMLVACSQQWHRHIWDEEEDGKKTTTRTTRKTTAAMNRQWCLSWSRPVWMWICKTQTEIRL